MSDARSAILGRIRGALRRGALGEPGIGQLRARLEAHRRNLVPARAASLDHAARIALFVAMAEEADATVAHVAGVEAVPEAVAAYLSRGNLPMRLVMAPDPRLDRIPWERRPLLEIRRGRAEDDDAVGLTACFAGIAETGTLMLLSGPESPSRNNFLPDTDIVVLYGGQVLATYEDGFDQLRMAHGAVLPRTVNFITGPSRTADIEQRLELGAHGPRRLHIVLVDAVPDAQDGVATA